MFVAKQRLGVRSNCQGRVVHPKLLVRASSTPVTTTPVANKEQLLVNLDDACRGVLKAPPSMRLEFSKDVTGAMEDLKAAGLVPKWGSTAEASAGFRRRNVFMGELRQAGIKNPDAIAKPSVRNESAFLFTVVGSTSLVATAAGVLLPGDWGFFTSYLVGAISLVVLAVGSTAPGLLQVVIDKYSQLYPDYKERVVRHEAAHFLLGYLMGVPVAGYSFEIGREHTEFAEAKIQKRIIERTLEDEEIDTLAVMAVAGVAAEGQFYEEVMGQTADLVDLQRLLMRSRTKLSDAQQQSITRWAVFAAGTLLKRYKAEYEALIAAMANGASVATCVTAIESAAAPA